MGDVPLVAVLAVLLGTGGIGAVATTIITSVQKARAGVATREDQRRADIIRDRDEALREAESAKRDESAAKALADMERFNRILWMEHAARQRIRLISAGLEPDPLPEHTDPKKER